MLLLVNETSGELLLQARRVGDDPAEVLLGGASKDDWDLCIGVVNYVARTHEALVLGDASRKGMFVGDPGEKQCV